MAARTIGISWSDLHHPYLTVAGVAILYGLMVFMSEQFVVEPGGLPFFLPSFGLLASLLLLTARSLWPLILVSSATFEFVGCAMLSPEWQWIDRIAIIGTLMLTSVLVARHASVGLTAVARRSHGALVSLRLAQALVGGTLLLLPLAWAWDQWRVLPYLAPVPFAAAAFLGFALFAPFALSIRYPLIGPGNRRPERIAQIVAAAATLLLLAALPLLPLASGLREFTIEYHHVFLLASVLVAMWLASRADARVTAGIMAVVAFVYGAAINLEQSLFVSGSAGAVPELLAEQTYLIVLFAVCFWMAVLGSERRRQQHARLIREQIAEDVLRTSDEITTGVIDRAIERLDAAVLRVGQFARAAECRLYAFDNVDRIATIEHYWREDGTPYRKDRIPPFVAFHRIAWIMSELQSGNDVRSAEDAESQQALAAAADALSIAPTDRVWLRPILLGGEAVGAVGVIEPYTRLDWRSDVGDLLSVIGDFFADVVQRSRAQERVHSYERDLRELASHVAQAEERTRRETAVALHDGLGQTLAVARMKLREMQSRQPDPGGGLDMLLDIVDSALDTTRHLINTLNPTVLYELGLMPALETLRDTVDATSEYDVILHESGERIALDESTQRVVYEAARELVSNAVRHSRGDRIWIDVRWRGRQHLECRVCDDGIGITDEDTRSDTAGRFGLFLTRERLGSIRGKLDILGRTGGGTCAIIRLDTAATAMEGEI
jgi:signal transduction histidine kinase